MDKPTLRFCSTTALNAAAMPINSQIPMTIRVAVMF
jgi:hypothetical protein